MQASDDLHALESIRRFLGKLSEDPFATLRAKLVSMHHQFYFGYFGRPRTCPAFCVVSDRPLNLWCSGCKRWWCSPGCLGEDEFLVPNNQFNCTPLLRSLKALGVLGRSVKLFCITVLVRNMLWAKYTTAYPPPCAHRRH